jgi:small-conductance mechanosensitive channel
MNTNQAGYIKSFLNKCKILINEFDDLDGFLIPREIFLDKDIYNSVKEDISVLKQVFTSSALTSLQSNAEENQKWPLLNLVRQILRSCHFIMTPKRVSAGYTKDGKKIYKRMFIISKLTQTEVSTDSDSLVP